MVKQNMHEYNKENKDLYGLAYQCPYIERKEDCPFKLSDNFSFKEKVKWIDGLSIHERKRIEQHHIKCYHNREFK